jgi:Xaa-Pro aminopeptidase
MTMLRYVVLLAALAGGCASAGVERAAAPAGAPSVDAWLLPALPPAAPMGADEFARRRAALLSTLGAGVLVVTGSPPPAHDYLPFAQDHDFRYLTGITEPGAAYIAVKAGGRVEEFLFVQPRDPAREAWEGARLGPDGASARVGIPALPATRFVVFLDSVAAEHRVVHVTAMPPRAPRPDADLSHAEQLLARLQDRQPAAEFRSVAGRVRQLRARKSPAELDRIRRAVYISALAHREAMRATAPGMNEFEIRALHEYMYVRNGAEGPAYASIVGSGPNATVLHYGAADRFMEDGDLLLVDAAASYGGYAADITRTFPVNGRFSPEQRAVYEVVLAAHKAAAALIRRGATWAELQDASNRELREGMARIGLIDGPDATHDCGTPSAPATCPQYRLFYIHGLGHGVGLAVHDPDISELEGFQPGSAVTIEPGIYVRADTFDYLPDTPANRAMAERLGPAFRRFVGTGVRIEDVYIFDDSGVERASAAAPREIDEIEALMREASFADGSRRADIVEWYRINQGR